MHHCRGDHGWRWLDTPGICSPSLSCLSHSRVYPCRRIATTSYILVWGFWSDTAHGLHSGEAGKPANSLCIDLLGDVRFYIEHLSEIFIGVLALLR